MQRSPFYLLRIPSLNLEDLENLKYDGSSGLDFFKQFEKNEEQLIEFAKNEDLLNGLQYSSQLFLNSLKKLKKKLPSSYKKKDRQVQRRLLDYIHRMTFNASPFSTFSFVQLQNDKHRAIIPKEAFTIHLNKKIWSKIDEIVNESDNRDFELLLKPNSLLKKDGKSVIYLFMDEKKVQINRSRLDEIIVDILSFLNDDQGVLYSKLFQQLFELGKHSAQDIHLFIRALIRAQIIYPVWQSNNVFFAKKILSQSKEPASMFLASVLEKFIKGDLLFDKAKVESYITKKEDFGIGPLFYEHAYKNEFIPQKNLDRALIEKEVAALYQLCSKTCLDSKVTHQANDLIDAFKNWIEKEIKFDLNDLQITQSEDCVKLKLEYRKDKAIDVQMGVMLKHVPAQDCFLLINWTTGYGKYFRRFIKNYEDKTQDDFSKWVRESKDNLFQNNDRFIHNANDQAEELSSIEGFGFKDSFAGPKRIEIDFKEGELRNKTTGEVVFPIDLSIQNPQTRSSFYNFINSFAQLKNNYLPFLKAVREKFSVQKEDHVYTPEIRTQHLLLSQKIWAFKNSKYFRIKEEDLEKRFYLLNSLRSKLSIPRFASFHFTNSARRYIDFENPISLDAFYRRIDQEKDSSLTIEALVDQKFEIKKEDKFYEIYWEFKSKDV